MSTTLKAPNRLKGLECKKGQLSSWPPVPYVPVTDLVTTKKVPQVLKVKLSYSSILNMSIYSHGNTKEYLAHIVAGFCIIKQKGLDVQCRKHGKAVVKLTRMFKIHLKAAWSKDIVLLDDDVEARKLEVKKMQKILQETQKQYDEAIIKTYKQLRNLLSSDPQSQWDCVCRKMHKCDSWAGVNGQVTVGRHPHMWAAFQDCLELHKLTVFSADSAERQRFYIQVWCTPRWDKK
jgi:hypothetical protein